MISRVTKSFRKLHDALPSQIQRQAKSAYRKFQDDPSRPGLQFKQIHPTEPIYSVRINRDYRAVGVKSDREIIWFWIGSHSDYDKLIAQF